MSNKKEGSFRNLHEQFLAFIDPKTTKLPTPVVTATTQFSKTLRDALVSTQKAPHDHAQAQEHYDTLIEQRERLLQNPLVQSNEELSRYLNDVIVNDGDAQSSLKATWRKHVDSYSEREPVIILPDIPKDFNKIHAQFWEYLENTQETLKTGIQHEIESFTATLGAAIAHGSAGNSTEAVAAFKQCIEDRRTLLENPRIQQNPALNEYITNVMADIPDAHIETSLRTTTSWHDKARKQARDSDNQFDYDTVEYDLTDIEDTPPLLSPEEEEQLFNGTYGKDNNDNVFDLQ